MSKTDPPPSPHRLLTLDRAGVLLILLIIAGVAGSSANIATFERGLGEDAVWTLEASVQREGYQEGWFGRGASPFEKESLKKAFDGHPTLPPLMPALISASRALGVDAAPWRVASRWNALWFALLIVLVGLMGLEAGGLVGGLTAALGIATIPRIFGIATQPGLGMAALFFLTLTPFLLQRATRSASAAFGATVSLALAIQSSISLGLFIFIPWVFMTLAVPRRPASSDGFAATPPIPLRNFLIVPVGIAVGIFAYPYLWHDTKDHLELWLTHFLRAPAVPFSYAGEVWGEARPPWHLAPYLLIVTVPPAYLLFALAGWRGGALYQRLMGWRALKFLKHLPFAPNKLPDRTDILGVGSWRGVQREEILRLAQGMFLFTLMLPLLFRSPYFGGVDLISLILPWMLIYAGAGMARVVPVVRRLLPVSKGEPKSRHGLRSLFVILFISLMLFPPLVELVKIHPFEESYYSWLIGGPEGARRHGLPRYPMGPIPRAVFDEMPEGEVSIGLILPRKSDSAALRLMLEDRPELEQVTLGKDPFSSRVILLSHDDLDPRYEEVMSHFFLTLRGSKDLEFVSLRRDGVPIFSIARPAR